MRADPGRYAAGLLAWRPPAEDSTEARAAALRVAYVLSLVEGYLSRG